MLGEDFRDGVELWHGEEGGFDPGAPEVDEEDGGFSGDFFERGGLAFLFLIFEAAF